MTRGRDPSTQGADPLEDLSKSELVARADALGIDGARKFTRIELLDEIRRIQGPGDRGFLGKARDLLRDVLEKGIAGALQAEAHVGATHEVVSGSRASDPSGLPREGEAAAVAGDEPTSAAIPTVTLVEIFLAQGHVDRAREVLDELLRANPRDEVALRLAARVNRTGSHVDEPSGERGDRGAPLAAAIAAPNGEPHAHAPTMTSAGASTSSATPATSATPTMPATSSISRMPAMAATPTIPADPSRAHDAASAGAAPGGPGDGGRDAPASGDPYSAVSPFSVDAIEPEAFLEPTFPGYSDAPIADIPSIPSMLDDEPWPARYGVDECVAMSVDPSTLYVYWEVRPSTCARARRVLAGGQWSDASVESPGGDEPAPILRVVVVEPNVDGPVVATRDFDVVDVEIGEYFIRDLPASAILRAAIGLRSGDRFLPMAHTIDIESPPTGPSALLAREIVVWTERGTFARGDAGADDSLAAAASPRQRPALASSPAEVAAEVALPRRRAPLSSADLAETWPGASAEAGEGPTSGASAGLGAGRPAARAPSSSELAVQGAVAEDRRLGASERLPFATSSASWADRSSKSTGAGS